MSRATTNPNEYPKMLYEGGIARDETGRPVRGEKTRTVKDAAEEAEAVARGFHPAGAGTDDLAYPAEGLADHPDSVDADGDGHNDTTGEFVSPNTGRRGRQRK